MDTISILAAPAGSGSRSGASWAISAAVLALVVALIQHKRKRTPKSVGVLMLIAGAGIAGATGIAGDFLRKGGALLGTVVNEGTAKAFGVAVPAVLVVGVGLWVAHDLWPRTKTPSKQLPWLALALPTLMVIAGGVWAGVGGDVLDGLGTTTADVASAFVKGW